MRARADDPGQSSGLKILNLICKDNFPTLGNMTGSSDEDLIPLGTVIQPAMGVDGGMPEPKPGSPHPARMTSTRPAPGPDAQSFPYSAQSRRGLGVSSSLATSL